LLLSFIFIINTDKYIIISYDTTITPLPHYPTPLTALTKSTN
jgi:hypothetical protein